jgi:hypothetical protein
MPAVQGGAAGRSDLRGGLGDAAQRRPARGEVRRGSQTCGETLRNAARRARSCGGEVWGTRRNDARRARWCGGKVWGDAV